MTLIAFWARDVPRGDTDPSTRPRVSLSSEATSLFAGDVSGTSIAITQSGRAGSQSKKKKKEFLKSTSNYVASCAHMPKMFLQKV